MIKVYIPSEIKRSAKIAIIGEKSIMPNGGMKLLKNDKYGSTILPIKRPNPVSRSEGIQDIKM